MKALYLEVILLATGRKLAISNVPVSPQNLNFPPPLSEHSHHKQEASEPKHPNEPSKNTVP